MRYEQLLFLLPLPSILLSASLGPTEPQKACHRCSSVCACACGMCVWVGTYRKHCTCNTRNLRKENRERPFFFLSPIGEPSFPSPPPPFSPKSFDLGRGGEKKVGRSTTARNLFKDEQKERLQVGLVHASSMETAEAAGRQVAKRAKETTENLIGPVRSPPVSKQSWAWRNLPSGGWEETCTSRGRSVSSDVWEPSMALLAGHLPRYLPYVPR